LEILLCFQVIFVISFSSFSLSISYSRTGKNSTEFHEIFSPPPDAIRVIEPGRIGRKICLLEKLPRRCLEFMPASLLSGMPRDDSVAKGLSVEFIDRNEFRKSRGRKSIKAFSRLTPYDFRFLSERFTVLQATGSAGGHDMKDDWGNTHAAS
jgi:hypothetical protein